MSSYDPSAVMSVRPRSWLEAWVAARIPSDEQRRAVWINEARVQGERAKAKRAEFALDRKDPLDNAFYLHRTQDGLDSHIEKMYAERKAKMAAAKEQQE